ncbi:hypothetical protein CTAYLR_007456 [Chrysophaeum taylorii]|uniref:Arf-GAP domain-containing protein n=1 Tax=Chrysophaeum taylorii TaxID=2483200 RepID=A0AAD7UCB1_9STRA|nr:hypothetical protein CTAYLR_007456 [Chrysophaeum taylorii]
MASDPQAEKDLEALRRLPGNKACANCGVLAAHGHGAVVMPFATFVCHTCKSAHQSFSHLCKSVSMSFWTKPDVAKLRAGGNVVARSKWQAKLAEPLKPSPTLSAAKDFVRECYVQRRWYDDAAVLAPEAAAAAASAKKPQRSPPRKVATDLVRRPPVVLPPGKEKQKQEEKKKKRDLDGHHPVADLLSFDADAPEPPPPKAASSSDLLLDMFAQPNDTAPAPLSAAAPPVSLLGNRAPPDPFAPLPSSAQPAMQSRTVSSPPPPPMVQHADPFAGLTMRQPTTLSPARVHSAPTALYRAARPPVMQPPPIQQQQQQQQWPRYANGGYPQHTIPPPIPPKPPGAAGALAPTNGQPADAPTGLSSSAAISQMSFF